MFSKLLESIKFFAARAHLVVLLGILVAGVAAPAAADSGVRFRDIVPPGPGLDSGITYERVESETADLYRALTERPFLTPFDLEEPPNKWRGAPGVALFDYDRDGDLDIFVTNGPGADHSLFSNQRVETGRLTFEDVAVPAGVAARDQDGSGVCFGDTDNDGDDDLFVLSAHGSNRFFENNGDGTFTDLSSVSGLSEDSKTSVGCSFGDVNGDGLLDVAVANNTVDWRSMLGIGPTDPFLFNEHNQLFLNTGGHEFVDVSATSGIQNLTSLPPGQASVTWAIAMVDYDLDGDVDILHADDQGGVPPAIFGGVDRGLIFVLQNDGSGGFTDVTGASGTGVPGGWMGLSFGDLNSDGFLDVFGTNIGDWGQTTITPLDPVYGDFFFYQLGQLSSRWFLGGSGGVFTDPGIGDLVASEFGWGTSMADYDNDGDTDILYHGGLVFPPFINCGNPGLVLANDGSGNFSYDLAALAESTDHARRVVQGMAVGDLDDDGFVDIVSVSSTDVQDSIPLTPYKVQWGSPLDGLPAYEQLWAPTDVPGLWEFSGFEENANGTLAVEISDGGNGNRSVKVELVGSVGLTPGGTVNRSGIGAIVSFAPRGGSSTMRPVLGGSSYASQDSLELTFGLGRARRGQLDVLWPGGVRNRLHGVRRGERVVFPEIPCSFDGEWNSFRDYSVCVRGSLRDLLEAGVIGRRDKARLFVSALLAFLESR